MPKLQGIALLIAMLLAAAGVTPPAVFAAGLNPVCGLVDNSQRLACDLRLGEAAAIDRVEASWDGGKTRERVEFNPFDHDKSTIAASILVNPIANAKPSTVAALDKLLEGSGLDSVALSYRPGLAIAAKGAEQVMPIGSEPADLGEKLRELFHSTTAGRLLPALTDAVATLAAKPADRRILLVVGGAFRRDDSADAIEALLTKARQANMVIHTIGFTGSETAEDAQPGLATLASVTGGIHIEVALPGGSFPDDYAGRLIAASESGGYATVPTGRDGGSSELMLIATMADGREVSSSLPFELPELSTAAKLKNWIFDLRTRQPALTTALAALAGALVLGSLAMFVAGQLKGMRRQRDQRQRGEPLRQAMAAVDQSAGPDRTEIHRLRPNRVAWFEPVGGNNQKMPIRGSMIRIGRHEENDVRLASKTVHRYHAVMHRTPEDDYVVTDLSGPSGNGVIVNGAKVQNVALREGDVIELGEMKLRFRISAAA